MTRRVILGNDFSRKRAIEMIVQAPDGYVCEVREQRRTNAQNDKFWSMLTDISIAKPGGQRYTPDEWKPRIMQACGFECQFLPGILDGHPFPVGFKSSQLTKSQMAALITWMQAWGDEAGVRWSEPKEEAA
jgi:hypothetical protein